MHHLRIVALLTSLVLIPDQRILAAPLLESGFTKPPAAARPWVYWFIMDGNLSREGITADFEAMARRVFENLKAVLSAGGATFSDVVRATVYLRDLSDFQKLNAIYAEYFGDHKPARSTVGVAALPKGATVEIDLIAVIS